MGVGAGDDLDAHGPPRAARRSAAATRSGRPFLDTIPHAGQPGVDETHGFWRRVGDRVATAPARRSGSPARSCCSLLARQPRSTSTPGQTQRQLSSAARWTPSTGQEILARNFPAGSSAPTDVIVPDPARPRPWCRPCRPQSDFVAQVRPARRGPAGHPRSRHAQGRPRTRRRRWTTIPSCATSPGRGRRAVLVGGPTAQEYDLRQSAARDNQRDHPADAARRVPDPRRAAALDRSRRCCCRCR